MPFYTIQTLTQLLDRGSTTLTNLNSIHALIITNGLHQSYALVAKFLVQLSSSRPLSSTTFIYASKVFSRVRQPNVFLCNTLLKIYSNSTSPQQTIIFYRHFFKQNLRPDNFTFPPLLYACTQLVSLPQGIQIHTHIIKTGLDSNVYTQTELVRCLAACGFVADARQVFDEMEQRGLKDSVAWTAMICAYSSEHGDINQAFKMFKEIPFEKDVVCWNSMIVGFIKWGEISRARKLFDEIPKRDVVCWTAMISGYVQRGDFQESLNLFNRMRDSGAKPNRLTFVSALCSCAHLGAIKKGMSIHEYIVKRGIYLDKYLGTTLVDMYAKCGQITSSLKLFDIMPERDVYSWNTMIEGLAVHGLAPDALKIFSKMQKEGLDPNEVTFVGILTACSHMCLVKEGHLYFDNMINDYGITPRIEHYGCMVDLLGRAGFLDKAEEVMNTMPFEPNAVTWGALLGACKVRGNVELGERAFSHLIDLEPEKGGNYILMSNIYAAANRWDGVEKVREMLKASGIRKVYGFSHLEIGGLVHEFVQGDKSLSKDVYQLLEETSGRLREMGHRPMAEEVLHDVEEEEKEYTLSWHSEKLALAFGILNTSSSNALVIVKNLRMCQDCHSAFKFYSRIFSRMIIVRDRIRFHHFTEGVCSCKDFW